MMYTAYYIPGTPGLSGSVGGVSDWIIPVVLPYLESTPLTVVGYQADTVAERDAMLAALTDPDLFNHVPAEPLGFPAFGPVPQNGCTELGTTAWWKPTLFPVITTHISSPPPLLES